MEKVRPSKAPLLSSMNEVIRNFEYISIRSPWLYAESDNKTEGVNSKLLSDLYYLGFRV